MERLSKKNRRKPQANMNNIELAKPMVSADERIEAKSDSEKFLALHYQELKDLGKHFLTIVSGVFAISVTFSEKMIDFTKATGPQKGLIIGSWSFLIAAVVAAGTGIYG
jgi:glutamine phosphoribosylpyrophosphate amidotransferase